MLIDGDNTFFDRQFQLFGRTLHDADIGLMRDQPVNVGFGFARFGQHRARGFVQDAHGEFEHRLAVHAQARVTHDLPAFDMAGNTQNIGIAAIGMHIASQNAGFVAGFEHHGARAIAKQHAGRAVLKVE